MEDQFLVSPTAPHRTTVTQAIVVLTPLLSSNGKRYRSETTPERDTQLAWLQTSREKGWNMTKRTPHQLPHENRLRMLDARIERAIAQEGFFIMGVFPTAESPGPHFAYTVGVAPTEAELLMFGLDIETMAHLFQTIVEEMRYAKALANGSFTSAAAAINNISIWNASSFIKTAAS